VTIRPLAAGLRVVLLDIEGTTTPIAFVHEHLFPYARRHLGAWLSGHAQSPDGGDVIRALSAEHAMAVGRGDQAPPWHDDDVVESARRYALWLMDRDRKSSALKDLQGLIWEGAYQAGELRGVVFPDVAGAMARWRREGLDIVIYSSGSELAQRRLFESTADGDLTPLISHFFDTRVGPKVEADSYRAIAAALRQPVERVLFVSDAVRELAAAQDAGCHVVLSVRPGNPAEPGSDRFERVTTFAEIA